MRVWIAKIIINAFIVAVIVGTGMAIYVLLGLGGLMISIFIVGTYLALVWASTVMEDHRYD